MFLQIFIVIYHSPADRLWLSKYKMYLIHKKNDLMDLRWTWKYYYTNNIDTSGQETQRAVFKLRKNKPKISSW